MAIGNYVHYRYENYIENGLTINSRQGITEQDISKVFEEQIKRVYDLGKTRKTSKELDLKKIENQLNFWFDARNKKNKLDGIEVTQEELEIMEKAINNFLEKHLQGVDINMDTLRAAVLSGNFNEELLKIQTNSGKELLKVLQSFNELKVSTKTGTRNIGALQSRINALLSARDCLKDDVNSQSMKNSIDDLEKKWKELVYFFNKKAKQSIDISDENNSGKAIKNTKRLQNFVDELNTILKGFRYSSAAAHGEYAETAIVAMNALINYHALKNTSDLFGFINNALNTEVKGKDTSRKILNISHFDSNFTDLGLISEGTHYKNELDINKETSLGYFSTKSTQDKVDIIFNFKDGEEVFGIPASVKNYNLQNTRFNDIHLLSGRSVLVLVQEFEDFVNHYLNVMAEHPDKGPSSSLIDLAHYTMKLTVLLKAIQGGVETNKGISEKADLFIINDNSQGRYKVYTIDQILDKIIFSVNKLEDILKTGDLDNTKILENKFIGTESEFDENNAKKRISNLLNKLHQMELKVSISKSVFQKDFDK